MDTESKVQYYGNALCTNINMTVYIHVCCVLQCKANPEASSGTEAGNKYYNTPLNVCSRYGFHRSR